jgi:hypothetical protein
VKAFDPALLVSALYSSIAIPTSNKHPAVRLSTRQCLTDDLQLPALTGATALEVGVQAVVVTTANMPLRKQTSRRSTRRERPTRYMHSPLQPEGESEHHGCERMSSGSYSDPFQSASSRRIYQQPCLLSTLTTVVLCAASIQVSAQNLSECSAEQRASFPAAQSCLSAFVSTAVCPVACCCIMTSGQRASGAETVVFAPADTCFVERSLVGDVETLRILDFKPLSSSACGNVSRSNCGNAPCQVKNSAGVTASGTNSPTETPPSSMVSEQTSHRPSKTAVYAGVGGGLATTLLVASVATVVVLCRRRQVAMQGLHVPVGSAVASL